MAKIIDLRGTGGQMVLIGDAFALPTSNAVTFTANTPIVAGSMRFNPTANRIEFIGVDAETWNGITSDGGTYAPIGHTHLASEITNLTETVQDLMFTTIVAGNSVTLSYNDPAGSLRIDADVTKLVTLNNQTGTAYTLLLADSFASVRASNAGAITITVPTNATTAFPVGTQITVTQAGAGQVTFVGAGSVVINSCETLKLRKQFSTASLLKIGTDEWDLVGDLEALP